MRYLKTTEAATLLDVAPNTLRVWERRFGFPTPRRSPGGHRFYMHGEVAALRDALRGGLSISAAVLRARDGLEADAGSLIRALLAYDADAADRALEKALGVRSVESSVEEALLPSLEEIIARFGPDSAPWSFATRWATDWLGRARRLATPPDGRLSVMLGYALRDELDPDAPYVRALELFCVRAGINVLSLPAQVVNGLGNAAAVYRPDLVVLAGGQLTEGVVGRWSSGIARAVAPIPFVFYRPASDAASRMVLPPSPTEAQLRLVELAHRGFVADGGRPLERRRRAVSGA
jgi:MerR family transcriptional regulator, light-induced transcriptional regulator